MTNYEQTIQDLKDRLIKLIDQKKRVKFQISKDVRFNSHRNASVDDLAMEYSKLDVESKQIRDTLAADGCLVDWSKESE